VTGDWSAINRFLAVYPHFWTNGRLREAVNSAISQNCCLRNNQWLLGSANDRYCMWLPAWSDSTV